MSSLPRPPWGHRERLKAFCAAGALLTLAGAVAAVAGVAAGDALAVTGAVLCGWEAVGLWLWTLRASGRDDVP